MIANLPPETSRVSLVNPISSPSEPKEARLPDHTRPLLIHTRTPISKDFGNRVRIRGKSIEGCGCSDKAVYKSAAGGRRGEEGRRDRRARGWIATHQGKDGKERRRKGVEGWRAEGLLAEGDERQKSEGEGETGAQCYRCIRVKLVLSTSPPPPPLLLLPPFIILLLSTHSRTVFGTTSFSPPSSATCTSVHTRIYTRMCVYIYIYSLVDGKRGGLWVQRQ